MPRVSAAFFATGVVCVLIGMIFGMWMGASNNFVAAPAHAHLNLLGWVTMGLYGTFYSLARETFSPKLAWTNYALSLAGVAILIPALVLYLSDGNDPKYDPFVTIGSIISFLAMLVFAVSVFKELMRSR
ncbi:MAG: hypothetical protein JO256_15385 [Alphaproteobacteria bacterium]|nr:hypothetical protein [Alphaproteobacteria bacterium]